MDRYRRASDKGVVPLARIARAVGTVIWTRGVPLDMERVDVRGEVCPRPALIVRRRLADLDPGETLLVEGDYPPAEENLRRTCGKHGFEVTDAGVEEAEVDESGVDESGVDESGVEKAEDADGFELAITVTEEASLQ
jgi:tRNA 2-thiouridine synthesizing protein A